MNFEYSMSLFEVQHFSSDRHGKTSHPSEMVSSNLLLQLCLIVNIAQIKTQPTQLRMRTYSLLNHTDHYRLLLEQNAIPSQDCFLFGDY